MTHEMDGWMSFCRVASAPNPALAVAVERPRLQERTERRQVHEELQALRGNIRVLCR